MPSIEDLTKYLQNEVTKNSDGHFKSHNERKTPKFSAASPVKVFQTGNTSTPKNVSKQSKKQNSSGRGSPGNLYNESVSKYFKCPDPRCSSSHHVMSDCVHYLKLSLEKCLTNLSKNITYATLAFQIHMDIVLAVVSTGVIVTRNTT